MKQLVLVTVLCLTASAGAGRAQSKVLFDHVQISSPDVPRARQWYVTHMGGKTGDKPDHAWFGRTWFLVVLKSAGPKPSAGSALDHIAFSFPDVDAKVRQLSAAGVRIVTPARDVPGWFKSAFVEDPDGTLIELVEDRNGLGFHHVHLKSVDPAAELNLFRDLFGGTRTKFRGVEALEHGEVKLLADKGASVAPSDGHAIDHMAFRTDRATVDQVATLVRAKGIRFTVEPHPYKNNGVEGVTDYFSTPSGIKLEILARTPDYQPPQ